MTNTRRGDGVDTCKFCGSDNLWGNHFDSNDEGVATTTPPAAWDLLCQDCGKFQIRRNRKA